MTDTVYSYGAGIMPAPVYTGASLIAPPPNEKLRICSWNIEGLKVRRPGGG